MRPIVHHDLTNSVQDFRLLDDYEAALRDLLHFYDRVRGAAGHGEGWTAADVLRLEQIRALALSVRLESKGQRLAPLVSSHSRQLQPHSGPNGSGKPFLSKKARKSRPRRS